MISASETVLVEAFHAARVEMREAALDLEAIKSTHDALKTIKPTDESFPAELGHAATYTAVRRSKRAFERYLETAEQLAMVRP